MGQGRGARFPVSNNNSFMLRPPGSIVAMGGWSLLVVPAVLGGISLFMALLAGVESHLFE
jgi:hypothetical protein